MPFGGFEIGTITIFAEYASVEIEIFEFGIQFMRPIERTECMSKPSNLFRKKEITYASGLVCPKTTALFFDKIWIPEHKDILISTYGQVYENIPSEVTFCENDLKRNMKSSYHNTILAGSTRSGKSTVLWRALLGDLSYRELILNTHILANKPVKIDGNVEELINLLSPDVSEGLSTETKKLLLGSSEMTKKECEFHGLQDFSEVQKGVFATSNNRNRSLMDTASYFRSEYGIEMTPIFVEKTEFEKDCVSLKDAYPPIKHNVIDACIQAIPSVIEEQLSWDQVVETRKDKKAIVKMRKFKNWANQNLEGKSPAEIADILYSELEDYEDTLKKHGIKTTIGGFSTILSGASSILAVLEGSQVELAAAGIAVTAGLVTFTSDQVLDYYEKKNTPIAFIYDITKKIKE